MKVGIFSDIHSNWAALVATLKDARREGVSTFFFLGDVVGYGPFPQKCLDRVREVYHIYIKGNHEEFAVLLDGRESLVKLIMNENSYQGLVYTRSQLSDLDFGFIDSLPEIAIREDLGLTLAHGAISSEHTSLYVENESAALRELQCAKTSISLIGHTHAPYVYGNINGVRRNLTEQILLHSDEKFLINVGSVGQPRDGDCRSCYAILEYADNGQIHLELRRVFYNIQSTELGIVAAKLPLRLATRLYEGS
jgi:predicted phosphodiesterase